jgi:hypothetical protein
VGFAVMSATERHGEFIAGFAAHGADLRKAQVMGVRWQPRADQARLRGHEAKMLGITSAAGLCERRGFGRKALRKIRRALGAILSGFGECQIVAWD